MPIEMMKENHKAAPPRPSRVVELRAYENAPLSSQTDPIDIILNQNLSELSTYKTVNSNDEWSSFMNLIK